MLEAAQSDEALNGREMVRFSHERIEEHFKPSSATSGSLYDLIFANASLQWCDGAVPALMARMLARVRPGGSLAVQILFCFCGVAVVLTLVLRQQDAGAPAERERLHAS